MKNILSSSTTINDNVLINLIINIYITFINIRFTMSANVTIYMCMIRFKKNEVVTLKHINMIICVAPIFVFQVCIKISKIIEN